MSGGRRVPHHDAARSAHARGGAEAAQNQCKLPTSLTKTIKMMDGLATPATGGALADGHFTLLQQQVTETTGKQSLKFDAHPDRIIQTRDSRNFRFSVSGCGGGTTRFDAIQWEVMLKRRFAKFWSDEAGATAIEYGLIAAGIALAIISIINLLGGTLNTNFTSINTSLK
jgi:pilus assembly protein Flp/PilA